MANSKITALPFRSLPYISGEMGIVDNGITTYQANLQYWGLSDIIITYDVDETINTVTKAGRTTTFTRVDGQLQECSDGVIAKTFEYNAQGQIHVKTISKI